MNIKWLGHSSFLVHAKGKSILFDPWFQKTENNRLVQPAASVSSVGKVDLILVTHEHFDHFNVGEVEAIAGRNFSVVIGPTPVTNQLNLPNRLKMAVTAGESFNLMGLDISVTQAAHPQCSEAVGFIVSDGEKTVYHAGDTYDFYGLSQVTADVALLPIGGTYTMDVLSAITALKKIRAKYVIPMHYDTFAKIKVNIDDFMARVKNTTRTTPIKLSPGEAVEI